MNYGREEAVSSGEFYWELFDNVMSQDVTTNVFASIEIPRKFAVVPRDARMRRRGHSDLENVFHGDV